MRERRLSVARRGQSLIEALIALAVGGMLVGTAAALMAVVLRVSSQNVFLRAASALNEGLLEQVTSYAERKWYCTTTSGCGLYNLNKGFALGSRYKFVPAGPVPSRLDSEAGTELITLEGVGYTRWFYVQNLCRDDDSGNITGITDSDGTTNTCGGAGGSEDPSTQRVVAVTEWNEGGVVRSIPLAKYVSRNRSMVFRQTGWEGGSTTPPVGPGVLDVRTVPDTRFFDANGVDYRRVPGTLILTNIPIWP